VAGNDVGPGPYFPHRLQHVALYIARKVAFTICGKCQACPVMFAKKETTSNITIAVASIQEEPYLAFTAIGMSHFSCSDCTCCSPLHAPPLRVQ